MRSLLAKQSKNSSENGSNGSSDWLSKNNAEKSEASTESPDESDSDTDDTFVEAPKLTPAQRQADAVSLTIKSNLCFFKFSSKLDFNFFT